MDAFASRFGQIYGSIKKKPYDILDQRKTDFDGDFEDFLRQMRDLEGSDVDEYSEEINPVRCSQEMQNQCS